MGIPQHCRRMYILPNRSSFNFQSFVYVPHNYEALFVQVNKHLVRTHHVHYPQQTVASSLLALLDD